MGKYFGTDGVRGVAGADLTCEMAMLIGRGAAAVLTSSTGHKPRILIGKDTRRSSYMFEYSLVSGLTASGADAYLLHVTTTPSVAYMFFVSWSFRLLSSIFLLFSGAACIIYMPCIIPKIIIVDRSELPP